MIAGEPAQSLPEIIPYIPAVLLLGENVTFYIGPASDKILATLDKELRPYYVSVSASVKNAAMKITSVYSCYHLITGAKFKHLFFRHVFICPFVSVKNAAMKITSNLCSYNSYQSLEQNSQHLHCPHLELLFYSCSGLSKDLAPVLLIVTLC